MTTYIRIYLPDHKLNQYVSEYEQLISTPQNQLALNWDNAGQLKGFRSWFFNKTGFHLHDDVDPLTNKWFMLVDTKRAVEAKLAWC